MAAMRRGWMRKLGLVLEHGAGSLGMKTVSSLLPSLETQLCLAWRGQGRGQRAGSSPRHCRALSSSRQVLTGHAERSGQGGHARKQVSCWNTQKEHLGWRSLLYPLALSTHRWTLQVGTLDGPGGHCSLDGRESY